MKKAVGLGDESCLSFVGGIPVNGIEKIADGFTIFSWVTPGGDFLPVLGEFTKVSQTPDMGEGLAMGLWVKRVAFGREEGGDCPCHFEVARSAFKSLLECPNHPGLLSLDLILVAFPIWIPIAVPRLCKDSGTAFYLKHQQSAIRPEDEKVPLTLDSAVQIVVAPADGPGVVELAEGAICLYFPLVAVRG
jgi:hypothetical protein